MATALDLVTRAMRKLRVIGSGEEPTAAEGADCLSALNDMLAIWEIEGIDLAPTALVLSDTIDLPDSHIEALCANLAIAIADDFGAQVSPLLHARAESGKASLMAYHFAIADLASDHSLARRNLATDD